jgi:hypothetical protein
MRRIIDAAESGFTRQIGRYHVHLSITAWGHPFLADIPTVNLRSGVGYGSDWNAENWWIGDERAYGATWHEIMHLLTRSYLKIEMYAKSL